MGSYPRPFFEIDHAVVRVGQATAHVAAQEERVSSGRQRGDDTAQSERLLSILKEWQRLEQRRYECLSSSKEDEKDWSR